MVIAILMIIVGIWMMRWVKQFEAQRRKELFDQLEFRRKMTDNVLRRINAFRSDRIQVLQFMSNRISQVENKKESILRDFKEMLNL